MYLVSSWYLMYPIQGPKTMCNSFLIELSQKRRTWLLSKLFSFDFTANCRRVRSTLGAIN